MSQLDPFRRLGDDNKFKEWLVKERETAITYLVGAVDIVIVHRAQGQVQLIEKLLDMMEKAKTLR